MNGYIEGKQIISFLSPFSIGINSQRITSCRNLYFPVTVDPSLKGFHCPKKQTGSCKTQKLSPFEKKVDKQDVPIHIHRKYLIITLP